MLRLYSAMFQVRGVPQGSEHDSEAVPRHGEVGARQLRRGSV